MQFVSEFSGDPGAQDPDRDSTDVGIPTSVETDIPQAFAGGCFQGEQGTGPLNAEDEQIGTEVGDLRIPAPLAELPDQPVSTSGGVEELFRTEPTEHSFRGDPAVLVQLNMVLDLPQFEGGQIGQAQSAEKLQRLTSLNLDFV